MKQAAGIAKENIEISLLDLLPRSAENIYHLDSDSSQQPGDLMFNYLRQSFCGGNTSLEIN